MREYIERDAVLAKGAPIPGCFSDMISALDVVNLPAADVVPVRHGRWIEGAENFTCGNHNAECSVCGANISWSGCDGDFNYCPNCGAKMDIKEYFCKEIP